MKLGVEAPKAQVQKVRKETQYTTTIIGGAKELAEWKASQERLEKAYQSAQAEHRAARRQNAVSVVNGGSPARELTETEKAELTYRARRNRPTERSKPVSMLSPETLAYIERHEPKKTLIDHFKSICSKVWNNAFDSER